ncbi:glycosyltransferase [bacterium]|nr:glycosyltransferase [bacterium]
MSNDKPFLSVVITTLNEGKRLPKTLKAVINYLNKQNYVSEIILVDADSKDDTIVCAEKFKEQYKNLRIYVNKNDRGKGEGIGFGIGEACGEYVLFMDADNSTGIEQIEKLMPFFDEGYDVVVGSRYLDKDSVKKKQGFMRRFLSRSGNILVQRFVFQGIKDTQCGFKCFKAVAAKEIFSLQTIFGFGFDMEILAIANHLGYKIKEVSVDWYDDADSRLNMKSATIDSLITIFEIYRNISYGKYILTGDKKINNKKGLQGIILAGGFGTRLTPITDEVTKSMVKAANKPILEYMVELFKTHGIENIKIGVNYLPFLIEKHFGQGEKWGVSISYPIERDPMGTAGAVKRMIGECKDTVLVAMGDVITDINLEKIIKFHKKNNSKVTIALKEVEDTTHFGIVVLDETGRVKSFQEKPSPKDAKSNLANIGIYVLEKEAFDLIPSGQVYDFGNQLFPLLLEENIPFYGFQIPCYWKDIGTMNSLYEANEDILTGKVPGFLPKGREIEKGFWIGDNVSIHKNSVIKSPVLIGDNTVISDFVEITGPAVVGDGCVLDVDAKVKNSLVLDGTYVGMGMSLNNKIADRHFLIDLNSSAKTYISEKRLLSSVEENKMSHALFRLFNIALAVCLLIVLSPSFLVNVIYIKLIKREKHLFAKETMVGSIYHLDVSGERRKKIFELYKYSCNITFLARYPELINVLTGDINVVGNAPLHIEEAEKLIQEYEVQRFKAPVGIVSLYDLVKFHADTAEEKIIIETYYAVNRTFAKDFAILWGHFLCLFHKKRWKR